MSFQEIEFIPTDTVNVKEEDVLPPGYDNASYLRANKVRYGEVFMIEPVAFLLVCSICDTVHTSLNGFGEHIIAKHHERDIDVAVNALDVKVETSELEPPKVTTIKTEDSRVDAEICKADNDSDERDFDEPFNNYSDSDEDFNPSKKRKAAKPKKKVVKKKIIKESNLISRRTKRGRKAKSNVTYEGEEVEMPLPSESKDSKQNDDTETTQSKKSQDTDTKQPKDIDFPELFCKECNRYYANAASMSTHIRKIHTNRKPILQCPYCDKEFPTEDEVKAHKNTHDPKRRYPCPHCPKLFHSRVTRQRHIDKHFGKEIVHKCTLCPKEYRTIPDFRHHNLTVHGIVITSETHSNETLPCDICGKLFLSRTKREMHMRWHTGESPFQCELCGAKFRSKGHLKEHMKRHNNERNYICKVCGKGFYTGALLKNHMVVHSTEKPFQCLDCGKWFSRKLTLGLHRKIHSDVYQYSCQVCGMQFKQSSGLYTHKKTHAACFSAYEKNL